MHSIQVEVSPAAAPAQAIVDWDGAGYVTCKVSYPAVVGPAYALRAKIDSAFRIGPQRYLITIGSLVLTLDDERRLSEVEWFANPGQWQLRALARPAGRAGQPRFAGPFDDDGRLSVDFDGEPEAVYDRERRTLCLGWGRPLAWCEVAPELALGVDGDGTLVCICLGNLDVPERELLEPKPPAGWMSGLRRRLRGA